MKRRAEFLGPRSPLLPPPPRRLPSRPHIYLLRPFPATRDRRSESEPCPAEISVVIPRRALETRPAAASLARAPPPVAPGGPSLRLSPAPHLASSGRFCAIDGGPRACARGRRGCGGAPQKDLEIGARSSPPSFFFLSFRFPAFLWVPPSRPQEGGELASTHPLPHTPKPISTLVD